MPQVTDLQKRHADFTSGSGKDMFDSDMQNLLAVAEN